MDSGDDRRPPETAFGAELAAAREDAPTDERVYRTALELYEPTTVSTVAERADCSKTAARRHLSRLADIGLLRQVLETPAAFERNESYFAWRRHNRLAELDHDEYRQRLGELLSTDRGFREEYGVDSPDDLDPLEYGEHGDPEAVWLDVDRWTAVREEISQLQAARDDDAAEHGVA